MSYRKYNVGIGGIRAEMKKMGRPKSDNAKKKVLSIRVPDQLYSQMLAYAEQHKMTTTDIVLKGVEILLSEQKNSECFSLKRRKLLWRKLEKICEEDLYAKEKYKDHQIKDICTPIQTRWADVNLYMLTIWQN